MASFGPSKPDNKDVIDSLVNSLFGELERRRHLNVDAPSEMLDTWHSNQDPAKERSSMMQAFKESSLGSLGVEDCIGRETYMYTLGAFHQSPALYLSRPRKQTHTQTHAGQEGYTPGALQPSSALYLSCPRKQTHTQTHAGHETNTAGASQPSSAPYPSQPKVRTVANPPQQPDMVPMRIPQQTSYEITEIKLRDVSFKLGGEWRTVGTYLGFGNSQIEVMQEEYRVVKECIFQMLLKWRNTKGVKATKNKLKKALRRSQREDLADFIDESDDESE